MNRRPGRTHPPHETGAESHVTPAAPAEVDAACMAAGPSIHHYAHDAMACTWGVVVVDPDEAYARRAARAAFEEIDRLERELSRFVDGSDVSRLNALRVGESLRIGLDTLACLELASRIHADTGGAFDVTVGALLPPPGGSNPRPERAARVPIGASPPSSPTRAPIGASDPSSPGDVPVSTSNPSSPGDVSVSTSNASSPTHVPVGTSAPSSPGAVAVPGALGMEFVRVDRSSRTVQVARDGITVDLGGIGKGHAVDRAVDVLREWGVRHAVIHCGESTARAVGASGTGQPWRLALRDPRDPARTVGTIRLGDHAVSGSGVVLHGPHIIDPRRRRAIRTTVAAWSIAPTAAQADALSTAFMVLDVDSIRAYCAAHPGTGGALFDSESGTGALLRFGRANVDFGRP